MTMHIGKVAEEAGLTVDATRFYERSAILRRPPRTGGGFRLYGESDVETLAYIRRIQSLGSTLVEICELLALCGRKHSCRPVCRRLTQKLEHIRANLDDLRRLKSELQSALRLCHREMRIRSARRPLLTKKNSLKPERAK